MISLEDCIAMCGLDAKEIEAIAEHEHIRRFRQRHWLIICCIRSAAPSVSGK